METLQRTANRGSLSTGFDIDNSIKLEVDNNEWLYRDAPTAGNRKTFTISLWLKRAVLGHIPAGGDEYLAGQGSNARYHFAGDTIRFQFESGSTELESSRVYRDPSAWYHIVLAVDTSQGTAANRVKLYVNGEQQSWNNTKYPSLNQESDWMNTNDLYIGTKWASNSSGEGDNDLSGYLSEVVLLDGTAASPTSFGEVDDDTGIWKPIDVSGLTFGSQGFYLNFSNASSSGEDFSGNDNDLLDSNLSAADHSTDSPTNNFCTANPVAIGTSNLFQFTEGGTVCKRITADQWDFFTTTMPVNKGKWYGEFKIGAGPAMVGIGSLSYFEETAQSSHTGAGMATNSGVAYYGADGKRWVDGTEAAYGATFGTSDIISIAMDLDNDNVYFAKNGTWQNSGDPTSGATGTGALSTDPAGDYFVMTMNMLYNPTTHFMNYGGYTTISISSAASDANGYGTFEYAPPSGFYSLCTKNLAEYG